MRHAAIVVVWLVALALSGCSKHILEKPQPPAVVVCEPNSLGTGDRWVPGRWAWKKKDGAFVWREGHWAGNRRHTKWVDGYWVQNRPARKGDRKSHRYVAGHWQ